jgi:release factor glutamine methyltransferase
VTDSNIPPNQPSADDKVWTVMDVLKWSSGYLSKMQSPSSRLDAEVMLSSALKFRRIELYTNFDKPLSVNERGVFKQMLQRRVAGEPVAYIVGQREFYGRNFCVDKSVLIPRPDTELLIDCARAIVISDDIDEPVILDAGCGSGCIGLTMAAEFSGARVTLWDTSNSALHKTRSNAAGLEVSERVSVLEVDMLNPDSYESGLYDIVMSNPPYISSAVIPTLDVDVKDFEPISALDGGADGLVFYRALAENAWRILRSDGWILAEIGYDQEQSAKAIFSQWSDVTIERDLEGRPRVLKARKPKVGAQQ